MLNIKMSFRQLLSRILFGLTSVLLILLLTADGAFAQPQFDHADAVVVGIVVSRDEIGATEIQIGSHKIPAKLFVATVQVEKRLKGIDTSAHIKVRFSVPHLPAGGIRPFPSLNVGEYRILLLNSANGEYEFAGWELSSLPATANPHRSTGNLSDDIAQELAAVVESSTVSETKRLEAIHVLETIQTATATNIIRTKLTDHSSVMRAAAASALLQRNHVPALATAQELLLRPPADLPKYWIENIASAIGRGIKDEAAVPWLRALLESPAKDTRAAAAFALRNTGSQRAIPALAAALNDVDAEVRYYAVIGLGEITRQPEWRPLTEEFHANEQKYLQFWHEWLLAQGLER